MRSTPVSPPTRARYSYDAQHPQHPPPLRLSRPPQKSSLCSMRHRYRIYLIPRTGGPYGPPLNKNPEKHLPVVLSRRPLPPPSHWNPVPTKNFEKTNLRNISEPRDYPGQASPCHVLRGAKGGSAFFFRGLFWSFGQDTYQPIGTIRSLRLF